MASDHASTAKRLAAATGKGLLVVARHLFVALHALARWLVLRAIPATWRWLRGTLWPLLRRFYVWLPHRRKVVAGAALVMVTAIAVLAWRPGNKPATDASLANAPAPNPLVAEPVRFTFAPLQAPPGAPLSISGVQIGPHEPFEVRLAGKQIAAHRLKDGRIQAMVPVVLGKEGWPVVPVGRQVLEVHRYGRLVGIGKEELRITELQRAPGTVAGVQRSLATIADGYQRLFDALPAQDDRDRGHRRAVVAMLRGLASEGGNSLAAILAGTAPVLEGASPDLDLSDALLASSGAGLYLRDVADAFAGPAAANPRSADATALLGSVLGIGTAHAQTMSAPSARCRQGGKDMELACLMQAQAMLTDLSQAFVKPTSEAYARVFAVPLASMGMDAGASAAARRALVLHNVISALLSVANLVIEKIAPSMLPASLTRFEMEVDKQLIRQHDFTRTKLVVEARNNPQTITANDLVDLIKSIIGLPKVEQAFQDQVVKFFLYVVDLYLHALREVDIVLPKTSDALNGGLFTMPSRRWGPIEVTSQDLLQLFSYDESVLSTREREMEWRGEKPGQATIRMMPRGPGERSKVLLDNTLCWGCAWSGGAFGTDMPQSSKQVAVELQLEAFPRHGTAPLEVDFRWDVRLRDDGKPIPCTLDFGDGSPVERIEHCGANRSFRHTYPYTSRLRDETGGAYVATLRIDDSGAEGKAEVFPDWTFKASPASGKAPLDARFSWNIPWPPDVKAPPCELDPGDGSERQRFDDCLATTRATHRYERRGSFAPSLVVFHGRALDTKTAPVSVADELACDGMLEHKAWTGTVAYSQARDVWRRGREHTRYVMSVNLGGDLPWDAQGKRYFSPHPQGIARLQYERKDYTGDILQDGLMFSGSGKLLEYKPGMAETGSMLTLLIDERTCTYRFHLQAFVHGSGQIQGWGRDPKPINSDTAYAINAVGGAGLIVSPDSISGSAAFPVLTDDQILGGQHDGNWVSEQGRVVSALGEGNLGTVTVHWDFRPKK